jgi:hypothetical protein
MPWKLSVSYIFIQLYILYSLKKMPPMDKIPRSARYGIDPSCFGSYLFRLFVYFRPIQLFHFLPSL